MKKMIPINDCTDCPSLDHKGAWGSPANIPVCRKTGNEHSYTTYVSKGDVVIASRDAGIPDWCPLPDTKEGSKCQ